MADSARPFSNGTQYLDWQGGNCCRCSRMAPDGATLDDVTCEIERALIEAVFGDGRIPLPVAERMGQTEWGGRYTWPCKEKDPPFDLGEYRKRIAAEAARD